MPGCTAWRRPANGTVTSIVVWDGPSVSTHCLTALLAASARMGLPPSKATFSTVPFGEKW